MEFETGQSPAPYRSTLENCRKLSAINRLLKCSYLDNWVANHRKHEKNAFQLETKLKEMKGFESLIMRLEALEERAASEKPSNSDVVT